MGRTAPFAGSRAPPHRAHRVGYPPIQRHLLVAGTINGFWRSPWAPFGDHGQKRRFAELPNVARRLGRVGHCVAVAGWAPATK